MARNEGTYSIQPMFKRNPCFPSYNSRYQFRFIYYIPLKWSVCMYVFQVPTWQHPPEKTTEKNNMLHQVHLASWAADAKNYRDIAQPLVQHLKASTHRGSNTGQTQEETMAIPGDTRPYQAIPGHTSYLMSFSRMKPCRRRAHDLFIVHCDCV